MEMISHYIIGHSLFSRSVTCKVYYLDGQSDHLQILLKLAFRCSSLKPLGEYYPIAAPFGIMDF